MESYNVRRVIGEDYVIDSGLITFRINYNPLFWSTKKSFKVIMIITIY
jgi:hypothetical protein